MNLLQLQQGHKAFGSKVLFDQAQFSVNQGDHFGVIGPNGAGKTTLFRILAGQAELDGGRLTKMKGLRIGYLEQESDWNLDLNVEEFLKKDLLKPLWQIKELGVGLGLTEVHFSQRLNQLSGGFQMRTKLLQLIGQDPDLLLLDEPTNFLDLESVLALENFLQDYSNAFLMISHDREFLKRTTDHTLEIEAGEMNSFPGNIDDYFEQKALLDQMREAQAYNQEQKRQHLQNFVDRFRAKATKAKQAQSRMKQLEKMEVIETRQLPSRARISIPEPLPTGKEAFFIENADFGYETKTILKSVELRMNRGTHLGIVGYNGAGKSTLLKTIAGHLPLLSGHIKYGHEVSWSYYSQKSSDQLFPNESVIEALQREAHPAVLKQEILNMAGSLLFSGDAIEKKVRVLSGGERSRVALGQVLLKKSPMLLLDEPTNHLDFDTVEALTEALSHFKGSLVVVSHDRGLIRRVANQIVEIRDGKVSVYPGTYDDYVWSLQQKLRGTTENRPEAMPRPQAMKTQEEVPAEKINYKHEQKRLQTEIKEVERKILKVEELLKTNSEKLEQLNHDLLHASGPGKQELAKEMSRLGEEIHRLEENLISHMESQEKLNQDLEELRLKFGQL